MPMHISPSIDTDFSRTETMFPRVGPIANSLSPATQCDILGILQREQDRAMVLLSSSPLLTSLFVSYANQAAALESASTTPSPESEEWKALQNTIDTLHEEIGGLKSENIEMAEGLKAATESLEAFRSQVSSLKEANTAQENEIKSLRAELTESKEEYDRLLVNSNAERAALQGQAFDLETQRIELKDTVVEQQIKISKLERRSFPPGPAITATPTETTNTRNPDNLEDRSSTSALTRLSALRSEHSGYSTDSSLSSPRVAPTPLSLPSSPIPEAVPSTTPNLAELPREENETPVTPRPLPARQSRVQPPPAPAIIEDHQPVPTEATPVEGPFGRRSKKRNGPGRPSVAAPMPTPSTAPVPQRASGWGSWGTSLLTNSAEQAANDQNSSSPRPPPPGANPTVSNAGSSGSS